MRQDVMGRTLRGDFEGVVDVCLFVCLVARGLMVQRS